MDPTGVPTFDPDRLREHAGALRALAGTLVLDHASADDLVQATMLRAVERPPAGSGPIRAWLKTVLFNEARQAWRAERRRSRREQEVRTAKVERSTTELVEELEGHVLLARAIQSLDAIHREAILLRYFEDLPPRRIAQRLGLSVRTVESRIQRALARLREELAASTARTDRSWIVVLMPLVRPPVGVGIGVLGIMSFKVMSLSLIGAALLASVALFWLSEDATIPNRVSVEERAEARGIAPATESAASAEAPVVRQSEQESAEATTDRSVPSESVSLAGVLLDSTGRGLEGMELIGRSSVAGVAPVHATTLAGGLFDFSGQPGHYELELADSRYLLLVEAAIDLDPPEQDETGQPLEKRAPGGPRCVVIAELARAARGQVTDPTTVPIPDANLGISLPDRLRILFGEKGDRLALKKFATRADVEGRFEFPRVPAIDGLKLEGAKVGYEDATKVVAAADLGNLSLVLNSTAKEKSVLAGIVRGAEGEPLAQAYVAFGDMPARTDTEGRFDFEYDREKPPTRLYALVKGKLPVVQERSADSGDPWPAFVELRIDAPPKRIAGIVFGVAGEPLVHGSVMLARSTQIASWSSGFWCAENLVRDSNLLRISTNTDEAGRFVLDGLLDQEYELRVVDGARALSVVAGTFKGGDENVVIRLPADAVNARIEGRVIDRRGQPIPGAGVRVQCQLLAFQDSKGGKYYDSMVGSQAETDAAGRFVLTQVPVQDATIEVSHESLFAYEGVAVPERAFSGIFEITVFRRCEVRVEVDPSAGYTEFEL